MICQRCHQETFAFTGSYFDDSIICLNCRKTEEQHPLFEEARRVENEAVARGDYRFPGIGLPDDLKVER